MEAQTITQTINVLVGPGVPNTGFGHTSSQSPILAIAIGTTLCQATFFPNTSPRRLSFGLRLAA